MELSAAKITALGAYAPQKRLTNHDLELMVDTSDEWIVRRTGIRERRIAGEDEFASDLAIQAVQNLIDTCHATVEDVDMVMVTTFTPDHVIPTVAALVQGHFGWKAAGTMDLNAACTGFVYGLCVADSLIAAGRNQKILLIAAETASKVIDYTDRNTCILFGDAAVAALVEKTPDQGSFLGSYFTSDGSLADYVTCSHLSGKVIGKPLDRQRLFDQEGRGLYEYVLKNIPVGIDRLLQKNGLPLADIQWLVPHSANLRMIQAICDRLGFPIEQTLISNEYYGNTSSASIPLALWLAIRQNRVKRGDKLLLYGFGGGLTHGGIVIEW